MGVTPSAGPIFQRLVSAHAAAEPVNPELLCYVEWLYEHLLVLARQQNHAGHKAL
jgi:hypothetical protein